MGRQTQRKAQASANTPQRKTPETPFLERDRVQFVLLAIFVLMVSAIRWRLLGTPLERDEGEYAYFGQLILKGIAPYREAYNMKLPGVYYMYALFMGTFGQSFRGIHTGLMVMNAGTMVLLFLALKRLFNPMTGLLSAGFYGLMAVTLNVLGFAAHATHFAVFFIALALVCFARHRTTKGYPAAFLMGVMLGLAFLMKQHAVYFILFGGVVLVAYELLDRPVQWIGLALRTLAFSAGVFVPYLVVVLVMVASGTFDKFWFWTFEYARKYASGIDWVQGRQMLEVGLFPILRELQWIGFLAIVGLVLMLLPVFPVRQRILALAFALFAVLATTPGLIFRQHYFIVVLPATALLAAVAVDFAGRWMAEKSRFRFLATLIPVAVFLVSYSTIVGKTPGYYSNDDPVGLVKGIYNVQPFVEALPIAQYIQAHSSASDKVAVLGSEPEIAFYADRRSATGYLYTYGLMEIHDQNLKMQEEMIAEIEKAKPLYLVLVNVNLSWLVRPDSPRRIFDWYRDYAPKYYDVVGLVDIPDRGPAAYYWDADAHRNPANANSVSVLRRVATDAAARQP